jgi:uncharacterized caspase-like protein
MAKNQAIVIGINKYNPNNLTPLNYAKRDAELVRDFFEREAGFEKVYFFSDDAADIKVQLARGRIISSPSQPTLGNLRSFLRDYFETPRLTAGDNFWFFFAGHGLRYADRDYLMPCDANPRDVEHTAIPVSYVTERLRRCGADNVILLLDACRDQNTRAGEGIGRECQKGVITLFSCSPNERSYEIDDFQQGSFTYALLEALRLQGQRNCATVERLDQYLCDRVPELNLQHRKAQQIPYIVVEPPEKYHLILFPEYATQIDTDTLKSDAYRAEAENKLDLAEQLLIRVNIAASGQDMEALQALKRIAQRLGQATPPQPSSSNQDSSRSFSQSSFSSIGAKTPKIPPTESEPKQESVSDELISAVKADYTKLRDLLAAEKWKDADKETASIMCKVAGREQEDRLYREHIKDFPCQDLNTIDKLWIKYSKGHFGFSVQRRIWEELGAKTDYETECRLGDRVGWRKNSEWLKYSCLKSTLNATAGHLPSGIKVGWLRWDLWEPREFWKGGMCSLMARLEECDTHNVSQPPLKGGEKASRVC